MINERKILIDKITELLLYYMNLKMNGENVNIEILLFDEVIRINYYRDRELLDDVEFMLYDKELFQYVILGMVKNILDSFELKYKIDMNCLYDDYINIRCFNDDIFCLLITLIEYMKRDMNNEINILFDENYSDINAKLQPDYVNILNYRINLSKILIKSNCKCDRGSRIYE